MNNNLDILLHQAKLGEKKEIQCFNTGGEDIKYWQGRREALEDLKKLNELTHKWANQESNLEKLL